MPLTVGTAGHIDHGKTWLVRALTGKDTDRLPEEHERGISIDLGYAPLELPDGTQLSLVDVPGHERFVRNMVAGATGIDLFLLVIDAGEGARPQTHEHLAILRLLGVERGVVAVTKTDAVPPEEVELAVAEAAELVPEAEIVPVSAKTGAGLDDLRAALGRAAESVRRPERFEATRLWIDRAFSLRGIGTVVTGALWSGSIAAGDPLRLEPGGRAVRVRSVQVHDRPVEVAEAGQRVAVNLPAIERGELSRGNALVAPGYYPVTYRLDVLLEELEPVPPAVKVHIGTADVPARVVRDGRFAQLRLEEPVLAARGDRVVLRAETTVGGGRVVDPAPPRRLEPDRLEVLERGDPAEIVPLLAPEPVTIAQLQATGLFTPAQLAEGLAAVERAGDWAYRPAWLEGVRAVVRDRLAERARANPVEPGIPLGELLPREPWAPAILPLLHVERRNGKAYAPGAAPSLGDRAEAAAHLEAELADGGLARVEDSELAVYLESAGRLRRVGDGFAVSSQLYDRGLEALLVLDPITLASFRDALGISRRTAQLLLERYDADGLTRRVGDERVLRASARQQ
ncbi:MAG TPA: selenocysteine-specific translation elongation factor, partial [Gaiellaceae bacterium]|nr:selenocysteine-specific translation elongation factor [Gaiellaceae bacterium]